MMRAKSIYLVPSRRTYREALVERAAQNRRDAAQVNASPAYVAQCLELARAYEAEIAKIDQRVMMFATGPAAPVVALVAAAE